MDKHLTAIISAKTDKTAEALRQNHMEAYRVKDADELKAKLSEMMEEGSTWSVGGSMTLFETGLIDYLKQGPYTYFDRYAEGADIKNVYARARNCDYYFCSSNAITEQGELYNVDGRGNRISNLIDGPRKVIIVAGYNKIVPTIEDARRRVEEIAAPANAVRLNVADYKTICSHELVSRAQTQKGRITVFLLPQAYGY